MPIHDEAVAAALSQLALAADGTFLGVVLAYVAVRSILKFTANSSALHQIRNAPSVRVSDLRSLLTSSDDEAETSTLSPDGGSGKLVVLRGIVEAKSQYDGNWKTLRPNVLVSHESGNKGVILQRSQTWIYNEWRGLFGWTSDLHSMFLRSWKEQESSSLEMVPFVLVDTGMRMHPDYVVVNLDGSKHKLPLMTVYHHLQPLTASPYTFLQAIFGHEYPVGLLDEEKILPLGKEVTAVGVCCVKDGNPEIKSCKELPYFLSDLTKDQLVSDLACKTKVLLWAGAAFGSLAIGILGYASFRNWNRWKEWRARRQIQQQNAAASNEADAQAAAVDEESGEVPDGELCVICLMRRRRSAFIPCGHLVCCQRCALSVEREAAPKCPVCRQTIRVSVRIYDS